jgi:hypothetical protein
MLLVQYACYGFGHMLSDLHLKRNFDTGLY